MGDATEPPTGESPAEGQVQTPERPAQARSRLVRIVLALFVAALVIGLVTAGWAAYEYAQVSNDIKAAPREQKQVQAQLSPPQEATSAPAPEYALVVGLDQEPDGSAPKSDMMILARLDRARGTLGMLSIPRDTRVPIRGHGLDRINAAWPYGGPALGIATVREFTGLPVNHYIQIDFAGFSRAIDLMGGVWIHVDQDIRDNDTGALQITRGPQRLDGRRALQYVRGKRFASGDFTRIRHQQTFVRALIRQALSPAKWARVPAMARAVSSAVKTDMSLGQLISMAGAVKGMKGSDITTYVIPSDVQTIGGESYVIPDMQRAKRLFDDFRRGRP
jgi:LCP family protein required for cell wall assembly